MAHSLSAMKRIRQNEKRRLRNRASRSQLRTQIKKTRQAIEAADGEKAREILPQTTEMIDRMIKKGIIHKNTGSRYKSRLAGKISSISSS